MARVGSVRPGGRTERTRVAVLASARREVAEYGYDGFRIDRVAARAGVHKTTVYRRWSTKDVLLAELGYETATEALPLPDFGRLDRDLLAFVSGIDALLARPEGRVLQSVLASAAGRPELGELIQRVMASRLDHAGTMVRRAVERGEVPSSVDPLEVIRYAAAPIYYRRLVSHEPTGRAVVQRAVEAALVLARAGLL